MRLALYVYGRKCCKVFRKLAEYWLEFKEWYRTGISERARAAPTRNVPEPGPEKEAVHLDCSWSALDPRKLH